jgi:hypothetical protein
MSSFVVRLLIVLALPTAVVVQDAATMSPSSLALEDLPMLFRGPEPAVEVMVNGRGPFLFAIDTGGTDKARVYSSLLHLLGLPVSGTDHVGDGSGRSTRRVGTVRLDSVSVGALEFRRVKASTRDFNTLGLLHIDGILTFDLFRDFLLTLDYPFQGSGWRAGDPPRLR